MDRKIRVAAVSYLNTKPLVYGFEHGQMHEKISLKFEYPSRLAAMLINDEADIGLIPVAAILNLNEHHIITNYCIAASQDVASVCLFSDVPVEEINTVYLDYQSRTSVALLKLLLKHYWRINPELIASEAGYEAMIHGTAAGLVIGDRALSQRKRSVYIYDLASAWQQMTGLPFVFAAWVANKKLPDSFVDEFNEATSVGLDHIAEIVASNPFEDYDLQQYYTKNIDYHFNDSKRQGLKLFLKMISTDR